MYFACFPPKICQSNPEQNVRNKKSFPIFHNCFLIRCESTVSWTVGKSNLFAQKTKLPILLWWTGSESQIVPFKSAILLWTGLTSLGSFFPLLLKISLWRHQQRQFFLFYLSIVRPLFQPSFKSVWRRESFLPTAAETITVTSSAETIFPFAPFHCVSPLPALIQVSLTKSQMISIQNPIRNWNWQMLPFGSQIRVLVLELQ